MKVMLVVPTSHYKDAYPSFLSLSDFPSGFAYIAAALKEAGHKVIGFNPNNIVGYQSAKKMLQTQLSEAIRKEKPDLIGLGGLCTDYQFLKDAINFIRNENPDLPIVLGGGIITNDAEDVFNLLKPDFGIVGEGEEAIVKLCNGEKPEDIDNLWYWREE